MSEPEVFVPINFNEKEAGFVEATTKARWLYPISIAPSGGNQIVNVYIDDDGNLVVVSDE